jgi:uncharacterized protein
MSSYPATPRTKVRRLAKRGAYDKPTVHQILDEGFLCHIGFAVQETLYFHGSGASRMLKTLAQGVDVCVTVTLIDGFVLARSAFHHSMNYRSVAVLGRARRVTDEAEIMAALRTITDHVVPQRWDEVRQPNPLEMKQTVVLALALAEVSAKIRVGPPVDDEEDYARPVWAGVVPIAMTIGEPVPDGRVLPEAAPFSVSRLKGRKRGAGI